MPAITAADVVAWINENKDHFRILTDNMEPFDSLPYSAVILPMIANDGDDDIVIFLENRSKPPATRPKSLAEFWNDDSKRGFQAYMGPEKRVQP